MGNGVIHGPRLTALRTSVACGHGCKRRRADGVPPDVIRLSQASRSCGKLNSRSFVSRVSAPSSALRSGLVMPFSSATFSMSSVRREKRFRMSAGIPCDLEIVALAFDSESQVLKLVRQPHAKRRLEVGGVPLQFAELACFPAVLLVVPRRIEHEDVGMQLRVGNAVHRPGGRVDELRPDHIARDAVAVLLARADPGLHLAFHLAHRLIDRRAEGFEDLRVARAPIKQRDALGDREGEVVTDGTLSPRADRQLLAGQRMKVIAEAIERFLIDCPRQPQAGSAPLPPQEPTSSWPSE